MEKYLDDCFVAVPFSKVSRETKNFGADYSQVVLWRKADDAVNEPGTPTKSNLLRATPHLLAFALRGIGSKTPLAWGPFWRAYFLADSAEEFLANQNYIWLTIGRNAQSDLDVLEQSIVQGEQEYGAAPRPFAQIFEPAFEVVEEPVLRTRVLGVELWQEILTELKTVQTKPRWKDRNTLLPLWFPRVPLNESGFVTRQPGENFPEVPNIYTLLNAPCDLLCILQKVQISEEKIVYALCVVAAFDRDDCKTPTLHLSNVRFYTSADRFAKDALQVVCTTSVDALAVLLRGANARRFPEEHVFFEQILNQAARFTKQRKNNAPPAGRADSKIPKQFVQWTQLQEQTHPELAGVTAEFARLTTAFSSIANLVQQIDALRNPLAELFVNSLDASATPEVVARAFDKAFWDWSNANPENATSLTEFAKLHKKLDEYKITAVQVMPRFVEALDSLERLKPPLAILKDLLARLHEFEELPESEYLNQKAFIEAEIFERVSKLVTALPPTYELNTPSVLSQDTIKVWVDVFKRVLEILRNELSRLVNEMKEILRSAFGQTVFSEFSPETSKEYQFALQKIQEQRVEQQRLELDIATLQGEILKYKNEVAEKSQQLQFAIEDKQTKENELLRLQTDLEYASKNLQVVTSEKDETTEKWQFATEALQRATESEDELRRGIETLLTEQKELELQLTQTQEEFDRVNLELAQNKAELAQSRVLVSNLRHRVQELEEAVLTERVEIDALRKTAQDWQSEFESLEEKFAQSQQDVLEHREVLKDRQKVLEQTTRELEQILVEREKLEENLQELENLFDEVTKETKDLESQGVQIGKEYSDRARERSQELVDAINALKTQVLEKSKQIDELNNKLSDSTAEVKDLQTRIDAALEDSTRYETGVKEMLELFEKTEQKLTDTTTQLDEAQVQLDRVNSELENSKQNVADLTAQLEQAKSEISDSQEDHRIKILTLNSELEISMNRVSELELKSNLLTADLNSLKIEMDIERKTALEVQKDKLALEKLLDAVTAKEAASSLKVEQLNQELDAARTTLGAHEAELKVLKDQHMALQQKQSNLETELSTREQKIIAQEETITQLEAKIAEQTAAIQDLQADKLAITEQVNQSGEREQAWLARIQELDVHVKDLQTQLTEKQALIDFLESDRQKLSADLRVAKASALERDGKLFALQRDLANTKHQLETAQRRVADLSTIVDLLSDSLHSAQAEQAESAKQLKTLSNLSRVWALGLIDQLRSYKLAQQRAPNTSLYARLQNLELFVEPKTPSLHASLVGRTLLPTTVGKIQYSIQGRLGRIKRQILRSNSPAEYRGRQLISFYTQWETTEFEKYLQKNMDAKLTNNDLYDQYIVNYVLTKEIYEELSGLRPEVRTRRAETVAGMQFVAELQLLGDVLPIYTYSTKEQQVVEPIIRKAAKADFNNPTDQALALFEFQNLETLHKYEQSLLKASSTTPVLMRTLQEWLTMALEQSNQQIFRPVVFSRRLEKLDKETLAAVVHRRDHVPMLAVCRTYGQPKADNPEHYMRNERVQRIDQARHFTNNDLLVLYNKDGVAASNPAVSLEDKTLDLTKSPATAVPLPNKGCLVLHPQPNLWGPDPHLVAYNLDPKDPVGTVRVLVAALINCVVVLHVKKAYPGFESDPAKLLWDLEGIYVLADVVDLDQTPLGPLHILHSVLKELAILVEIVKDEILDKNPNPTIFNSLEKLNDLLKTYEQELTTKPIGLDAQTMFETLQQATKDLYDAVKTNITDVPEIFETYVDPILRFVGLQALKKG